jgi:hypothetical protein
MPISSDIGTKTVYKFKKNGSGNRDGEISDNPEKNSKN